MKTSPNIYKNGLQLSLLISLYSIFYIKLIIWSIKLLIVCLTNSQKSNSVYYHTGQTKLDSCNKKELLI